jgi:hypothetical protein
MKRLNAVRGVVFLTTLLASADVAEADTMVDRPTSGRHARCERCGQTGPTVPVAPVVFRVPSWDGFEIREATGHGTLGARVRDARESRTLPVRHEFVVGSPSRAVGVAVIR